MSTYAIGDIQGCFSTFERLLKRIDLKPGRDRLWLVGDLVNRGPRSLQTLRFLKERSALARVVLGNHDLHLIARAVGVTQEKKHDTLEELLAAPDRDDLIEWLRMQPLLHRDGDLMMVHAGVLPTWSENEAMDRAGEAEHALHGPSFDSVLDALRNRQSAPTSRRLESILETLRVLTRIRTVDAEKCPNFEFTGAPESAPSNHRPWFDVEHRRREDVRVIFGHWAALGLRLRDDILALDTGCVWGRTLTAVRLEDDAVFPEPFSD